MRAWAGKAANILSATATQTAKVMLIGDSWVANGNIYLPLKSYFQSILGDGGYGWAPFYSSDGLGEVTMTPTGTWTGKNGNTDTTVLGPDLYSNTSSDIATPGQIVATTVHNWDTAVIYYAIVPGGGSFQWKLGSGGYTVVSTANAATSIGTVTVAAGSIGIQSITVQVTAAGTAGVTLLGIDYQINSKSGARLDALGHSGSAVANWNAVNATTWEQSITSLNPDAIVILHGTNDSNNGQTATQFTSSLSTLLARIEVAVPNADVMVLLPSQNSTAGNATLASYEVPTANWAAQNGVVYVDGMQTIGTYALANARGLYAGTEHLNAAGGRVFADSLRPYFGTYWTPPINAQGQWSIGPPGVVGVTGVTSVTQNYTGSTRAIIASGATQSTDYLDITNQATNVIIFGFQYSGGNPVFQMATPTGTNGTYIQTGGYFGTNSANDTKITTNGNVGIRLFQDRGVAIGTTQADPGAGNLAVSGGITLGIVTVSALPNASTYGGMMLRVSDSTTITTEGQTCVGGGTTVAIAVSNGSAWKCL
jgi:hypothetical protein